MGATTRHRVQGTFGPKAVGALVPGVTRKAFEKYGFSTATLLTDWSVIVGAELARSTQPERLKWPRISDRDQPAAQRDAGATLVLRVDDGRAMDVQYRTRQIIDRINAHFGYRAVSQIRIIQAPLVPVAATPASRTVTSRPSRASTSPRADLSGIANEDLRAALARMQQAITGA